MSDFQTATLPNTASSLYKRVRYTTGLVLGVDEFEQEQTYFIERDRLHQRALHGYGTVHGLGVHLEPHAAADGGPEVIVAPGMAVDPQGQHICIPDAQCARVDDWLAQQTPETDGIPLAPGDPAERVSIYVVLRYRTCPTDAVPLPGKPCRSLEDTMTASRLEDDFALSFTFRRPPHVEEAVIRIFGELLHAIEGADTGPFVDRAVLLDLVRRLREVQPGTTLADLLASLSPPSGSPPGGSRPSGSPPAAMRLRVPRSETPALLRALMRVWVTEVRPDVLRAGHEDDPLEAAYQQRGAGRCSPVPKRDDAVLLAELRVPAEATPEGLRRVPDDPALIDVLERERPLLLATRLLQDGFTALHSAGGTGGEGGATAMRLDDLIDVSISGALTDTVLGWDAGAGAWVPTALPPPTTDHGALSGLADDDHPQYLPVDPSTRALVADLDADAQRIINLSPASGAGDAVVFEQAVKTGDAAGGDLAGTYPDPDVARLRGRSIAPTTPTPGQVLQWNGSTWAPATIAPGGSGSSPREETELVRIVALNWLHSGQAPLRLVLDGASVFGVAIAFGFDREDGGIDPARVRVETLTDRTVQVFTEAFDGRALGGVGAWRPLRLNLGEPIGLEAVQLGANGLIAEAASTGEPLVEGVFYPLDEAVREQIPEGRLEVVVRGAFIIDERGRALDAEHVRGRLPTGDRPAGVDAGVQGGRFESWLIVGPSVINVNTATIDELRSLPRVGPALAEAIVTTRDEQGGFETVDALTAVPGIGRQLLSDLRGRLTV